MTGIEPAWPAWKAGALPLSYIRAEHSLAESAQGFAHLRGPDVAHHALRRWLRVGGHRDGPRSDWDGVRLTGAFAVIADVWYPAEPDRMTSRTPSLVGQPSLRSAQKSDPLQPGAGSVRARVDG